LLSADPWGLTDPQKVPPTILSRCQRFDFKRIKTEDISKRLRQIVDSNGVYIEDKTLDIIARVSDGAMRDSISILDQCMSMSTGKVEYGDVTAMLGMTSNDYIFKLVDEMIEKNVEGAIKILDDIIQNGKDVFQFIKDLTKHFRNLLMVKVSKKPEDIIDASMDTIDRIKEQAKKIRSEEIMRAIGIIVEGENDAKLTSQPRILLEMAVIKFCRREYDTSAEMVLNRLNMLEEKINSGAITLAVSEDARLHRKQQDDMVQENVGITGQEKNNQPAETEVDFVRETPEFSLDEVRASWQEGLSMIKANKKVTVAALLALGELMDVSGNNIIIGFNNQNAFSKNNLENPPENKKMAEECFSRVLKKDVKLIFKVLGENGSLDESSERVKKLVGDGMVKVIE
jgi:DNA polymerase-3 subunit gamma/tau